jgi:cellulose synthase/poly-beta-1,6-N-acetylglucosamine synthase-like glycosyltransferase
MTTLIILFWLCLFIVFYTYLGYGIVLYIAVHIKHIVQRGKKRPPLPPDEHLPGVTLMICAYNEEDVVEMKMENCSQLNYPKDKLTIMWVTDGSSDSTNERLAHYPEVKTVFSPERKGKTAAMNHGFKEVDTEYTVMTDANTVLNADAIREIISEFLQDPNVACVAGEKRVMARHDGQTVAEGEGLYWKYESTLKRWDSELNSAMGAAGELCAIRTALYKDMPEDTLLDDFILSMQLVADGYRIAYSPAAYAMEYGSADMNEESKRKRRIAAGGLQSICRLGKLLLPFPHPLSSFQYVSHRVLRWSITPIALFALIPLNVTLVWLKAGTVYTVIWWMHIFFYAAAFAGYLLAEKGKKNKYLYVPYYFIFMNVNVFRGFAYLISHKNNGAWEKAKRG